MRRISVAERRARLLCRHRLALDPAAARNRPGAVAGSRGSRGSRGRVFVVPDGLAAVVQAACTRTIAVRERRRNLQFLAAAGITDPQTWLAETERRTLLALAELGEATGTELAAAEPRLREQIILSEGKPYGGPANVTTRVLLVLAAEGRIGRGRPRGGWTSGQFRWSPTQRWLPDGMPELDPAGARAELVRAWLSRFGPGTVADLQRWAGLPARDVARALAEVGAVQVELDGGTGYVLPDDVEPDDVEPGDGEARCGQPDGVDGQRVVLPPALDPTVMGWQQRGLVPRRAHGGGAVRPHRERRPDGVVRRAGGRRLGAAARR